MADLTEHLTERAKKVFIRKRGKKWQARVTVKGCPEQVKTFNTEGEALAWGAQQQRELEEQGFREPSQMTLNGALVRYQTEVSQGKKAAAKEASMIRIIRGYALADIQLRKIKGADIAQFRDQMKKRGYAPASIVRHLAILSHVFTTAQQEWGLGLENPVRQVKKPPVRNARTRRLSPGEMEKIIAATQSKQLADAIRLAIETCARRSELTALRWEDVNLDRQLAYLRDTKNGHPRTIPLSPVAVQILRSTPRRTDGKVLSMGPDSISRAFARACKRVGISDLHLHDLRREGISRLFEKGLSIPEVSSVSGHRTWSQLARYTEVRPEDVLKKLE